MDRFLTKIEAEEPTPGLELLINPLRHKKKQGYPDMEPDYGNLVPQFLEQNIERFRALMQNRIAEFKPHFNNDPIDYLIECIWFHFLFHDISPAQQQTMMAEYKRDNSEVDLISNIDK